MGPVRVLLVDDSEDMRLLCRLVLESDPFFEVWGEAGNGREAIAAVEAGTPDVIVLDLMMPVMDGFAALPVLQEVCPSAPIVVLTAGPTTEIRDTALALGARAVLTKEAALDQLRQVLREVCDTDVRADAAPRAS